MGAIFDLTINKMVENKPIKLNKNNLTTAT